MRHTERRSRVVFLVLFAVTCAARIAQAQSAGAPAAIVRVTDEIDLDGVGNARGRAEIILPPDVYVKLKSLMSPRYTAVENGQQVIRLKPPKIDNVLRYLGVISTAFEVQEMKGAFDDDAAAIDVSYRMLGRAGYHQGHWVFAIASDPEAKIEVHSSEIKGNSVILELRNRHQSVQLITRLTLNMPDGASKAEFRAKSLELVYAAPPPKLADDKQASRPELTFDVKPQLMSALYKMYGNPKWQEMWVARGVFQNDTAETLSDYRARFRIEGYSSWSPWKRTDRVFPGQTVVDAFYPIIDGKIANLKGATPAQVELEYEYVRPGGEKVSETEAGRTKLLGMNEAVWSSLATDSDSTWYDVFRNAQMVLASFTSATDPVVQDVVGLIGKSTGGAATSLSDQDALKFLGTLYNLFRQNIAYETTPGGYQDGLLHQHLKYGRDVLRTRSGTCVNLAILYASVCEAAGLSAYIVLGPGHAFPAAKLPQSGLPVFVEATGCGGGTKETSMTFVQAREHAFKTYQKWFAEGLMIETDIAASRQNGVPSPELPDLGVNPLKEWGIGQPEVVDQVYLPKLLVNVKSALDAAQLKYSPLAGKPSVQLNFKTQQDNEWVTIVQTDEDAEIMAIMSFVPGQVPENQRQAVAVTLAEYNSNFLHGNFDLSKAGLISYRTSTHVRGGLLAAKMVQNEIDTHFNFMQKHLPELRKLVSPPARAGQQQTAGAQPAATPVPATHPLVGKWKTAYRDGYGNLISQVATLRADGTFVQLASSGNGVTVQLKGRWSFKDNYLTATYDNQQTLRGPIKFINKTRVVFHDPSFNMDLTYDRVEEK